jgi:hypothetical protein
MAWIESHTVLIRHRKLIDLARRLRVHPVYALGILHTLWHAALEQQEDGDLSSWSDDLIADLSCAPKCDAPQYVRHLQDSGWLDAKLLHDWLEYAGRYLESKYRSKRPDRLAEIWAKHGLRYGDEERRGQPQDSPKSDPGQPTLPDLTEPDLPKKKKSLAATPPKQGFQKPSLPEVKAYVAEKKYQLDSEKFHAHYEANGWKVGRNPMKDWRAAVAYWARSEFEKKGGRNGRTVAGAAAPIPGKYGG